MNNLTEIISKLNDPTTNKLVDIVTIISEQTGLPRSIVKKGIMQRQFRINERPVLKTEVYIPTHSVLKFQSTVIKIDSNESNLDKYIRITLQTCFKASAINSLSHDQT